MKAFMLLYTTGVMRHITLPILLLI